MQMHTFFSGVPVSQMERWYLKENCKPQNKKFSYYLKDWSFSWYQFLYNKYIFNCSYKRKRAFKLPI